jgi:hypothetical protein
MIIFGGSSASIFVEVEPENKSWNVCKWLQGCHIQKNHKQLYNKTCESYKKMLNFQHDKKLWNWNQNDACGQDLVYIMYIKNLQQNLNKKTLKILKISNLKHNTSNDQDLLCE